MDRWGGMTALMFHGTVYPLVHKLSHPPIDSLHNSMFWHCLGIPNLWERKHPIIFALYGAAIRVKKLCRIWITVGRNKSDCYKSSLHVDPTHVSIAQVLNFAKIWPFLIGRWHHHLCHHNQSHCKLEDLHQRFPHFVSRVYRFTVLTTHWLYNYKA